MKVNPTSSQRSRSLITQLGKKKPANLLQLFPLARLTVRDFFLQSASNCAAAARSKKGTAEMKGKVNGMGGSNGSSSSLTVNNEGKEKKDWVQGS